MELVVIVKAERTDLPDILALQKLAYQSEAALYNDYSIAPLQETLPEMQKEFDDSVFLKAVSTGRIIGSLRILEKDQKAYIGRVIVHPDFQNQGIGTKLMVAAEKFFPHLREFELFTGYRSLKNIHFYQKSGYSVFKQEKISDLIQFVYMRKQI